MEKPGAIEPPRGVAARALGLLWVIHPLPSVMYVVAVALFAWLAATAAHHALDPARLVRALVATFCAQAAIGATNDLMDQRADTVAQPTKPLVRGLITPNYALAVAVLASVAVLLLLAPLGWGALAVGLLIEGLGLAYDFGLKGTWVSGLLFALYFPLIPLLAWVLFGRWQPFLPWVVPLGAALGVAMNVANTLPDLESDVAQGARGLPHLLGLRRGLAVCWLTPVVALGGLWALDLAAIVRARSDAMLVASAAGLVSVGVAVALYRLRPTRAGLRTMFVVQALGVVALAAGWLAAVAF